MAIKRGEYTPIGSANDLSSILASSVIRHCWCMSIKHNYILCRYKGIGIPLIFIMMQIMNDLHVVNMLILL